MGVSANEQETVISFSRNDKRAIVSTTDTTVMTKLDKYVSSGETEWTLDREETLAGDVVEKIYSVPKKYISFRSKTRKVSDELAAAAAERLKKAREGKKNDTL